MPKKLLTSAALVAFLMGLAACSDDAGDSSAEGSGAEQESQEAEMPEADVSDIPDVVAEVEGEEISGEEFTTIYEGQFQQMAMQSQMSGEEPDQEELKTQTLDYMVGNELIVQEAEDKDIEVSDEDVDALLEEAAEGSGLESVDDLIASAEEQGRSEDQLREDARKQFLMDQIIEDLDVEDPSEDELRELYDQATAQQPEGGGSGAEDGESGEGGSEDAEEPEVPSFEEARPQLEEQFRGQAEQEAAAEHIEKLREDADVETFLES